ncbi:MAG TPA: PIG-L family deacetylase [Bacteroidia bacterium]|nr:PIG-L family deacetylase [Bacteroidia bacterium]
MQKIWKVLPVAALMVTGIFFAGAQKAPEKNWNSARILHELNKMKHVGRVLYIAAHPDDENVELISYLVNVKGYETTYLSLTRGDGGQDLIGPEVREELGIIRTQELLMARSVDGGEQLFSRANDFGFSKTADETFHIWNRIDVLGDIVWAIRKYKPDIIITRFSPTYTKTHGHHQASAILAMEAFNDAADSTKYPEQLQYVSTWKTLSMFWNTSYWFFRDKKFDTAGLYSTPVGIYIPLLGKSVNELAAEAESMHKSQGNGSSPDRGDRTEYFSYLQGIKPENRNIFNSVNDSWTRIKGGEAISQQIENIISTFDIQHPEKSLNAMILLHHKLEPMSSNYLVADKLKQLEEIILQCAGVYAEATSNKEFLPVGDSIHITYGLIVQNNADVKVNNASLIVNGRELGKFKSESALKPNEVNTLNLATVLPDTTHFSGPYWLEETPGVGMYKVQNQLLRGLPQNPQQVIVHVSYTISSGGTDATFECDLPVYNKVTDPVKADIYSLARIVPPIIINPESKLLVFGNSTIQAKELTVKVKSFSKGKARIKVNAPAGWTISPAFIDADVKGGGDEQLLTFSVTPPKQYETADINIEAEMNGHTYNRSSEVISYDHIPRQLLLPKSDVKVAHMNVVTTNKFIGYIVGAGDDVPDLLKQLGYKVEIIPADKLATIDLKKYEVIISGIRAYNTVNELKYNNDRLMEYVKNGGNYIVQYNKNFDLVTDKIGPYPLHPSNTRTTEEDSKVIFLAKNNPALISPNKITDADFDGWVQERGLYYPDKWDTVNYVPILEMADSGEKPVDGSLLISTYGKGHFTYTGLSFFRELPAGVTGAYRLFVNLIELGKSEK